MSINNSPLRCGNFTSSEIGNLMTVARDKKSFGAPALTYIKKKNQERRLGRSISTESNAKPLSWGKLVEQRVFDILGREYSITSQETDIHPEIHYWVGSKDGMKWDDGLTVFDIKSPITLGSFCDLVDPLYEGLTGVDAMNAIRDNHKDGDTYYWQLVSNSIINGTKFAELIVYMPYKSELDEVRKLADGNGSCYWVAMACEDELPYLVEGGYYKNLNVIRFEVPQEDKDLLTERVIEAGKLLQPSTLIAQLDDSVNATIIQTA